MSALGYKTRFGLGTQVGDTPRRRVYFGAPCWNCEVTNTVIEVYVNSVESVCLSCARPQHLSKETINAYRPRKNNRGGQGLSGVSSTS